MVTEAQKRATKKYKDKHPDKRRLYQYRSNAKTYVRKYATLKDLAELKAIIAQKEKELKD